MPVFYFNLRFQAAPAPKAPMASKPKSEEGSGTGVARGVKSILTLSTP
ncbi:hypothetical protein O53_5229 [Microcystis aeruginosa TAIHU98]|uniref:Uncharacterized protein n=1 Tax=Microcystis aeruginosa TAIHU98 TaxID=1134457 RepID=L7DZU5_MICAE|nr:hypothetical protein O53_5229 [Microcystis aeruginosa TAIHU98]